MALAPVKSIFFHKLIKFLLEGFLFVVFLLISDILPYHINLRMADGGGEIFILPSKFLCRQLILIHPIGRLTFQKLCHSGNILPHWVKWGSGRDPNSRWYGQDRCLLLLRFLRCVEKPFCGCCQPDRAVCLSLPRRGGSRFWCMTWLSVFKGLKPLGIHDQLAHPTLAGGAIDEKPYVTQWLSCCLNPNPLQVLRFNTLLNLFSYISNCRLYICMVFSHP